MIKFLPLILFTTLSAQAQNLLTEQRSNIVLSVPTASDMSSDDYHSRSQSILTFVENKIYSKVPPALLAQAKAKTLRIEFTSKIRKGGMFNPAQSKKDELLLQIRENLYTDESVYRLIAHEWFHALHFVIHKDEPSWVREGLAQVFETMVVGGYNGPNLLSALENSTTPLEFSFDVERTDREAYGHVFTYFYFLYKNCGGDTLFWKITESKPAKFGADTLNAILPGNEKKQCSDLETSVLNAELARFHNRKIQGKTTQTDLYWLTPEFQRPPKTINTGLFDQVVLDELPVHQPLLLNKSYKSSLKPFLKNSRVQIYTLSKTYPYLITAGLTEATSSNDEVLFIMKSK